LGCHVDTQSDESRFFPPVVTNEGRPNAVLCCLKITKSQCTHSMRELHQPTNFAAAAVALTGSRETDGEHTVRRWRNLLRNTTSQRSGQSCTVRTEGFRSLHNNQQQSSEFTIHNSEVSRTTRGRHRTGPHFAGKKRHPTVILSTHSFIHSCIQQPALGM